MVKVIVAVLLMGAAAMGQGYVCAEGGNLSGRWAEEIFGWMVEKGGKEVVIVGAVPLEEDSRPDVFRKVGAERVTSLVVTRENADSQEVYDAIAGARVVFIRGGSQSRYVEWWTGTKTQAAIEAVYKAGGVVAGSSAGAAVLGEVDYDARVGSLSAREALADGRHENLTLSTGFLNLVPGVIFDTHFTERGRIARLPVMLAHCREDLKKDVLGIGLDPKTAVCIGPDGVAEVRGEGTVTLLRLTAGSKVKVEKGVPPMVAGVEYTQVFAEFRFDPRTGELTHKPDWIEQSRYGGIRLFEDVDPATIDGSKLDEGAVATYFVVEQPADAWVSALPKVQRGRGEIVGSAVAVRAFSDRRTANSVAGVIGAAVTSHALVALLMDETTRVRGVGRRIDVLLGTEPRSVVAVDVRLARTTGRGPVTRQRPVIEGALLHIVAPGWSLDRDALTAVPTSEYPERPRK